MLHRAETILLLSLNLVGLYFLYTQNFFCQNVVQILLFLQFFIEFLRNFLTVYFMLFTDPLKYLHAISYNIYVMFKL